MRQRESPVLWALRRRPAAIFLITALLVATEHKHELAAWIVSVDESRNGVSEYAKFFRCVESWSKHVPQPLITWHPPTKQPVLSS